MRNGKVKFRKLNNGEGVWKIEVLELEIKIKRKIGSEMLKKLRIWIL